MIRLVIGAGRLGLSLRLLLLLLRLLASALGAKALGEGRGLRQLRHRLDVAHVLLGVAVEPAVDADHDDARHVERDARGDDRVRRR